MTDRKATLIVKIAGLQIDRLAVWRAVGGTGFVGETLFS